MNAGGKGGGRAGSVGCASRCSTAAPRLQRREAPRRDDLSVRRRRARQGAPSVPSAPSATATITTVWANCVSRAVPPAPVPRLPREPRAPHVHRTTHLQPLEVRLALPLLRALPLPPAAPSPKGSEPACVDGPPVGNRARGGRGRGRGRSSGGRKGTTEPATGRGRTQRGDGAARAEAVPGPRKLKNKTK